MLPKEITKLTPRIMEHIIYKWAGKLSRDKKAWTKSDAKCYMFLMLHLKDMYHERYLNSKQCKKSITQ